MYSVPAVECVLNPDEVVNQRRYGVLPLNYGAEYQVAPVGLEPTTRGLQIMYSNRQSVMYCWRRRLVRVTRSQVSAASRIGRKRRRSESNHVLQSGSRRCIQMPNEGLPRALFITAVRTSDQVADC